MVYLCIAIGGALGSVARYWCSVAIAAKAGDALPWGTICVNVVGSLLIGVAMGAIETRWRESVAARDFVNHFFMAGVLGGFTTFSSFSLQTFALMRERLWLQASANVIFSVALCLMAVALGYWLMAQVVKGT